MLTCPNCGGAHGIEIDVTISVRLVQYKGGFETDDEGNDHQWDNDSTASCLNCIWVGTVGELKGELPDEEQE